MSDSLPDQLTPEQEAMLPGIAQEWRDIGFSTDRVDIENSRPYIEQTYRDAGLKPPKDFVFCESPLAGQKYIIEHNLTDAWFYGSMDAYWLSFYDAMIRFGADLDYLLGLIGTAKTSGWVGMYEDVCVVQDRPTAINMVDDRLSCEDGPALAYTDGFSIWSINGVEVDEQIVMDPESQTISQVLGETNEEVKRIRMQRYGWERFFTDVGAEEIDQRRNDIECTVEQLLWCERVNTKFLRTFCPSTGKIFALEIFDPENRIKTCVAAQSWLWGLEDDQADQVIVGRT